MSPRRNGPALLAAGRLLIIRNGHATADAANVSMNLIVNGKQEHVAEPATVADLLRYFDLTPGRVAVEVNRELVPRTEFNATPLRDGDIVEVVTFVGGG